MTKLFRLMCLAVAVVTSLAASAYDFKTDDGLCYNINSDGASVTVAYCPNLSGSLTIPSSVTYNGTNYSVTAIGSEAFETLEDLTSVTIPNSVKTIGKYAFNNCIGLTSVTIPNSVTSIGSSAFSGCIGLTSVTIPNSVTSIGSSAFSGCSGLTSVTIGNSVNEIGECAFGSGALESIVVEAGNAKYDSRDNCNAIIVTESNTLILGCKTTTIPNSVTTIGNWAFGGCSGLTSVTIPNSVTTVGNNAFAECDDLTSVTIGNSVKTIGEYAFGSCYGLTSVTIGNSVTYIGKDAFLDCNVLTSVTIPNSVTTIDQCAFMGCSGLTSLTIPNSVTSIGKQAFWGCRGMTSVTIGNSVTTIGQSAFSGCIGLTSVTIPNSVTSIGEKAFYIDGYPNSKTLTLCGNLEYIGDNAFKSRLSGRNIGTLILSEGVTNIKNLGADPGVIYSYSKTPPACDENSFTDYSGTLHVPGNATVAYAIADYWSNFTNLVNDAAAPQSLTLSQSEAVLKPGGSLTLTATVVPSNATTPGTVKWSTSNGAVATVDGNGRVIAVGVGECDITASLLDMFAVCHVTVQEQQVVITLDEHELSVGINKIAWLAPSMSPVNTDLAVESSDASVAMAQLIGGRVRVIGVKPGVSTVTVRSVDGKARPDECVVTVVVDKYDVNRDGLVDVTDVSALIDIVLGKIDQADGGDVNGDGVVDVADVSELIDFILGNSRSGVKFYHISVKGIK